MLETGKHYGESVFPASTIGGTNSNIALVDTLTTNISCGIRFT